MAKKYSTVKSLVADLAGGEQFARDVNEAVDRKTLGRLLFSMRASKGKTQAEVAKSMKCTQAKVSKIESYDNEKFSIGDVAKYCQALGASFELTLFRAPQNAVDKIKYHFAEMQRLLDGLCEMAKSDNVISQGVGKFAREAAYNTALLTLDCASKAAKLSKLPEQRFSVAGNSAGESASTTPSDSGRTAELQTA